MSITVPTNIPTRDRRTVAVTAPAPEPVRDPLSDYIHRASAYAAPLESARETARKALAKYEGASIHDPSLMIQAAVAFGMEVRGLLASLDAEDGAS
ncbi:hypothetical protein QMZ92_13360 [Streptomyces sp. HNM0645]|uniref:hypothetical protein n=1 Tax=Streptomyces sp. HNM0645 TaxID=2782343 RepID=UPI0024B6BC31|nr:hypothetical protein [Streptomyces sp. HNM0645]MDI9885356.1 hypothetical protein [Streptomyces sp. HNM0645]